MNTAPVLYTATRPGRHRTNINWHENRGLISSRGRLALVFFVGSDYIPRIVRGSGSPAILSTFNAAKREKQAYEKGGLGEKISPKYTRR